MKVLYSWLQDYVKEPIPSIEEIVEALTFHTCEIEEYVSFGQNDYVIECKILPDRAGDLFSHMGIAQELCILFGLTYIEPSYTKQGDSDPTHFFSFSLKTDKVRRAKKLYAEVLVGKSPDFIKYRLEAVGQRSINNIVDITNYVMLETGQPMHAFDFDSLDSDGGVEVSIRHANKEETIVALDGNQYMLDESMLVIADKKKALDIAGIKGGMDTGVHEGTKKLLLSVCTYDGTTIRKTSQILGLRSDASKRYENKPPVYLTDRAEARLRFLLKEYANAQVSDAIDIVCSPDEQTQIHVRHEKIHAMLGVDIDKETIEKILESIGCDIQETIDGWTVVPPVTRRDLKGEHDSIEEIGRIYGYENVQSIVPEKNTVAPEPQFSCIEHIKDILISHGYNEQYSYVFVDSGDIEVVYPIASDKSFLRNSLSPAMTKSLEENYRIRHILSSCNIKLFEVGTVFTDEKEKIELCIGVMFDSDTKNKKRDEEFTKMKEILSSFGTVQILENTMCIDITDYVKNHDKQEYFVVTSSVTPYKEFSRYPYSLRDIAVWVANGGSEKELVSIFKKHGGELLKKIDLFDTFSKEGRTSYAYHLVFQASEKTLTDEHVNQCMNDIYAELMSCGVYEVR